MPPAVAPEHFQTQQGFVARLTPELPRTFEAALGLTTGRFHRTAATGFAGSPCGSVIHAVLVLTEVSQFLGHRLRRRALRQRGQSFFQLPNDLEGAFVLELSHQGFEPGRKLGFVLAPERAADGDQVWHGVVKVQSLTGVRPAVVGQTPNP